MGSRVFAMMLAGMLLAGMLLAGMLLAGLLLPLDATAAVPLEMPLSGALRDNAGQPVGAGAFEVTFRLYDSADGEAAVWSETWPPGGGDCAGAINPNDTDCVVVAGGSFRVQLGTHAELAPGLFAQAPEGLWLSMQIETDPELPRRPLGSTPFAFHAAGLDCSGCVDASDIAQAAQDAIRDAAVTSAVAAVVAGGAGALPFDDSTSDLGANSVQNAIEQLKELIDDSPGLGGGGNVNEGAGQVIAFQQDRSIPAYGRTSQYVHLVNPSNAKVIAHMYGDEAADFGSSDNLVVAYDFAPNQYSAGAVGSQGDTSLQVTNPSIFNSGSHIMVHQTVGANGVTPGAWEINQVLAVNGTNLQLLTPLDRTYVSDGESRAQVVLAASFGQLEVVSGGSVRPSLPLAADGSHGGIVYVRANKITVKSGGSISADGMGFAGGTAGSPGQQGASECKTDAATGDANANCSGGGTAPTFCASAGGGGNATPGGDAEQAAGCNGGGTGGSAKGDQSLATMHFGGGGGSSIYYKGGTGGGMVVLGAQTFIVQDGGTVSADGEAGEGHGAGGGAGGTLAIFTEQSQVEGDVTAAGGPGGAGSDWAYISPLSLGNVSFETYSHGGGYSPKYREFWYPSWGSGTIHRFSDQFQHLGTFNSSTSNMMQLWGNPDGTYLTATWGEDRVRKFNDMGNSQQWEYSLGSTTAAACSDGETVYAMRSSGSTVWLIDEETGSGINSVAWPSYNDSMHGGLICTPGRIYRLPSGGGAQVLDTSNWSIIDTFNVGVNVYNMAFDGSIAYSSANNSSVTRHQLVDGNVYDPRGDGGDGGDGWVQELEPMQGIINESYPKGVEIHIDGVNVTGTLGDPNGQGDPAWDTDENKWGSTGLDKWATGPLDLTNAANWTLGEHLVELKETGGAGGQLKSYIYVIYPFTESSPPSNDTCVTPTALDPAAGPVVVSGTTEDIMGKTKAEDDSSQAGCGGAGGLDVVYRIDLPERSLLHAAIVAPFSTKLYLRSADCVDGDLVMCTDKEFTTAPIEAGTYFLFVDSDSPGAKGDFTLAVSSTPAPIPDHDTCESATDLIFSAQGVATVSSSSLYAQDDYKGLCSAALTGGPDVIYSFTAGTGQVLSVQVQSDFDNILYVMAQGCGDAGFPLACSSTGELSVPGLAGGTYWLAVDGTQAQEWGDFDLTVSLQ